MIHSLITSRGRPISTMDFFFFSKNSFIVHKGKFFLDCKDDLLPGKRHKHRSHDANFLCYYFVYKPFIPLGFLFILFIREDASQSLIVSDIMTVHFFLTPPHINQMKMNKIKAPRRSKFLSFLILQLNCFIWSSARSSQVPPPTTVMLTFFIFLFSLAVGPPAL